MFEIHRETPGRHIDGQGLFREARRKTARRHQRHDPRIGRTADSPRGRSSDKRFARELSTTYARIASNAISASRSQPSQYRPRRAHSYARVRDPSRNTPTSHRRARLSREARRKTARRHPTPRSADRSRGPTAHVGAVATSAVPELSTTYARIASNATSPVVRNHRNIGRDELTRTLVFEIHRETPDVTSTGKVVPRSSAEDGATSPSATTRGSVARADSPRGRSSDKRFPASSRRRTRALLRTRSLPAARVR